MNDGGSGDDKVGYKNPPRWTRWRKGISGNPNGRRRKSRKAPSASISDDILRNELDRTIRVTEGGATKNLKMREVVQRAQMNQAAKGNVRAQHDVLEAARELEDRDRQRTEEEAKLDRRVYERIVAWKAERARIWQQAELQGIEPEQPWPHPDDIIIGDLARCAWTFRGPRRPENVPFYEAVRAHRDVSFLNMIIAMRSRPSRTMLMEFWAQIWSAFDEMLPLRWQVGDDWELCAVALLFSSRRDLRALQVSYRQRAQKLEGHFGPRSKEGYRAANQAMKPLLKHYGYVSLAEFEAAYGSFGTDMAWPKPRSPAALAR